MPVHADFSNRNGDPFMADSPRGREWARNTRSVDDQIKDALARADSAGGLKMVTTMDESGRPIRTFELVGNATKRSTWLAPFMADAHEMVRLNKKAGQPDSEDNNVYQARWEEDQRKLASGTYTLPEIG